MPNPHTAIVVRAKKGDTASFSRLVRDFQAMAVGYAITLLEDIHLAEDAAQEAFLAAYLQIGDLRDPAAFAGWFRMIVRTACNRQRRKRQVDTVPLEGEEILIETGSVQLEEEQEMAESILSSVWNLPENERAVVMLHYVSAYTHQEIGAFLDIPVTTIQGRLRLGRKRLKEQVLERTQRELKELAPSRDSRFGDRVRRLVRPDELTSNEERVWSGGKGTDIWEMIKASIDGDLKTVKRLVYQDFRLVNCSYQYRQPVPFAVQENRIEVARYLLENGADATYHLGNPWHERPLTIAEERGYQDLVDLIRTHLEQKHQATAVRPEVAEVIRPLEVQAIKGLSERVPGFIDVVDDRGNKPIHWAALTRQADVVDLLLELGADVHDMRPDGARPLDLANGDYWFRAKRDVPSDQATEE